MMISVEKPIVQELTHYGVMGMKWGHHKPESASVTKARRAVKESKLQYKSANSQKQLNNANLSVKYAKADLSSAKILDKLNSKDKSKSQLAREAKYKAKGMTNDEAAVQAYKYLKTRNILIGIGTTAVVAGGAYAAYKIHDDRVDKIIKSGKLLQNISPDSSPGIRDAFYSSGNKLDNVKYKGFYGATLKYGQQGTAVKKQIKVLSDIKQVSPKNAQKALEDLVNSDPNFKQSLHKYIADTNGAFGAVYTQKHNLAQQAIANGKVDKHVYEIFNVALVDHSPEMQPLTDKYFGNLASKGYNALRDVNDSKYSGYKTINPIIAFNTKGLVDVIDIKELTEQEIRKAHGAATKAIMAPTVLKEAGKTAGQILAISGGFKILSTTMNTKAVDTYKKENPGTKLTNTEIARMLERSKLN